MRAALIHGAGDVRVEQVPDPVIVEPTDAIVRVVRTCVCGSDLHGYRSMPARERGRQIGHEFIGTVVELGPAVTGVAVDDFVIGTFAYQDNTCVFCREGVQTSCVNGGFFAAAQAEYLRVPQASGTLVPVPRGVDEALYPSLLTLSDVYLTGWHAAHLADIAPDRTVTVIGDGAVGLSAVLAARQLGAERIILMGRHPRRTELGREFGATDIVRARDEEGVAEVLELTDGEGSHIVLEAVGLMPAYQQAYGVVRPGGVISRVGVPQYEQAAIGWDSLFGKNARLAGGPAPVRAYLDQALPQVLSGQIEPGRVFDATMGLDEIAQAYAAMNNREALKVMIIP